MDTCDCCDDYIIDEREKCSYEPMGMLVCARCYDALISSPEETYPDFSMTDLLDALPKVCTNKSTS